MISSCLCNCARHGQAAWQNTSSFTKVLGANRRKEPICPAEISVSREIDALVTTSHVFQPNERRNAVLLLRFWLPNCDFLGSHCNEEPPGGGSPTHASGYRLYRSPHTEIFCLTDSLPIAVMEKMCRPVAPNC